MKEGPAGTADEEPSATPAEGAVAGTGNSADGADAEDAKVTAESPDAEDTEVAEDTVDSAVTTETSDPEKTPAAAATEDTADGVGAAETPADASGPQPVIATAVVSGDSTDVTAPVTDSFAALSLTKKVPAEEPADTGVTHTVNPSGSTAVPADSRRARRTREAEAAAAKTGSSRTTRMLVLIGSILIIVLLGIWLATVVADSNREEGVLEDSVAPIDLEAGACIQDFQSVNSEVTVVTCETPHNAQLVASESYLNSDSFPGPDALATKAEEVCSSVMYTDAASKYVDLELNRAVPTQSSWDTGDRRVDCFVVAPGDRKSVV